MNSVKNKKTLSIAIVIALIITPETLNGMSFVLLLDGLDKKV